MCRGDERRRVDDVWCLPVEPFLRDLVPSRGLLMLAGAISESPTPPLRIH
jgi:hypothetical protein